MFFKYINNSVELCHREGNEWKKHRCLFGKGSLEFLPPPK